MNLYCPYCRKPSLRSTDNESLYHPSEKAVKEQNIPPLDTEIGIHFICDNCGGNHLEIFDIVPRKGSNITHDSAIEYEIEVQKTSITHAKVKVSGINLEQAKRNALLITKEEDQKFEAGNETFEISWFKESFKK